MRPQFSTYTVCRFLQLFCIRIEAVRCLSAALLAIGSGAAGQAQPIVLPPQVVSAANFRPVVSPESLATVFGEGFSRQSAAGELDANGQLPVTLAGVRIQVEGIAARLVFVSPTQINFVVPAGLQPGSRKVTIQTDDAGQTRETNVAVARYAPGLFLLPCLRGDRGAILDAVRFTLEPFQPVTELYAGSDKRTRLALFGTGIRFATGGTDTPVVAEATYGVGKKIKIPVEFSGPAPLFAGLDQVNLVVPPALENAGLVTLQIRIGDTTSNAVTVMIASPMKAGPGPTLGAYRVTTLAGNGTAGRTGDGGPAIQGALDTPAAIAIDKNGQRFIAETGSRVIRRIGADGKLTTAYGSGRAGSDGDGGAASNASFRTPVSLAFDAANNLYIADQTDHRVRVVSPDGIIRNFAGTGVAGRSGVSGLSVRAQLSGPTAVAVDAFGAVIIADTGNHRIVKVTSDGLLSVVAGTGEAGYSGDGFAAYQSKLQSPGAVAPAGDGTLFFADTGNRRIRRIDLNGTIRTVVGSGLEGDQRNACAPIDANFGLVAGLAIDSAGTLWISDSKNHRVAALDASCLYAPIAGTGEPGFRDSVGTAGLSEFNEPRALAVQPDGSILVADSLNHRIRRIATQDSCQTLTAMTFSSPDGGGTLTATVFSGCSIPVPRTLMLRSNFPLQGMPASVVLPAGADSVSFTLIPGPNAAGRLLTVEASDGNSAVTGSWFDGTNTGSPNGPSEPVLQIQLPKLAIVAGESMSGTVTVLRRAVPTQPLNLQLTVDGTGISVASTISIPAGQEQATFLIQSNINAPAQDVTVRATAANLHATAGFRILPADGSTPGVVAALQIVPSSESGGTEVAGLLTLATPAGPNGIVVSLRSSHPAAQPPATVRIPAGSISAGFSIGTSVVNAVTPATVTASAANEVSATLTIQPRAGGQTGEIGSVSLSPNQVPGGGTSLLTITLTAPAGTGGVKVDLTSNDGAASAPPRVLIPGGARSIQVEISTTGVGATTQATITASSTNARSIQLTILPAGTGSVPVAQLVVQPASVPGGTAAVGTVRLAAAAPVGGISVAISSSHSAAMPPAAVFIPGGAQQATFSIPTAAVASSVQAAITATSGATSVSAVLTIAPSNATLASIGSLLIAPSSVLGGGNATGTVTLQSPAPEGGVSIRLTSSDSAATVPASLTIATGQSTGTFPIQTAAVTQLKQISLVATSRNSASATLTITVASAGTASLAGFSITPSSVPGGTSATGTITLAAAAPQNGVLVALQSNQPAVTVPANIVIPEGATTATVPVGTRAIPATVTATVTATSANSATASLTVQSGGAGQGSLAALYISPQSVTGGGTASGTVTLSAPAPTGGVLVNLASGNGAAQVPVSIVIPAGATSGSFSITTSVVSASTLVTISASSANNISAALTVQAASAVQARIGAISATPNPVAGGGTATGTVTLAATAPAGGVQVSLSSSLPAATVPTSLLVPAGQTSATFLISAAPVSSNQTATISAASENVVSTTLGIQPASAGTGTLSSLSISPSSVSAGVSATGIVTLGTAAGAGGVVVTLSSSNAAASVPASVLIAEGATAGTFPISTSSVANNTTATITATSANSLTATLTVQTSAPATGAISTVSVSPNTVTGGSTAMGTVILTLPAPAGGVSVNLSSSDGAATLPASITISAGQSIGTFSVQTTTVSSQRTATITASSATSTTTSLTINPAAPATSTIVGLSLSPSTVQGGSAATASVTLAAPAGSGGATIALSSSNSAAGVPATLTIPPGASSGTFTVTTSAVGSVTTATITAQAGNTVNASLTISASPAGQGTIGSLTVSPGTVASGASATGTVTLTAPAAVGGVLVALGSGNAAAQVPASLIIAAGSSSASFPVSTTPVSAMTTVAITASSMNAVSANLTIQAADPSLAIVSGLTINPSSVTGGAGATGTVFLAVPAILGGVSVNLSSADPAVSVPASVTVPAGQSTAAFAVATSAVAATKTATITASSLTSASASLTVTAAGPNTVALSSLNLNPTSLQGGTSSTGTVTLAAPAPAGGVSVSLLSNSGYALVPSSISIAAGATSGTFAVTTIPVRNTATATITASSANTVSSTLTVRPPCVSSLNLSVSITDLLSGNGTLSGTVTLTGPAPQGGLPISFVAGSTTLGSVTVPEGQTSNSVTLTVSNLLSLIGSAVTALTSSPCGGVSVTLQLGSPLVASLSISPSSVVGGSGATGTITLAIAAPVGGAVVNLVSSGPAVAAVSGSVTVPAGQTTGTFSIATTSPATVQTVVITASAGNSRSASITVTPAGTQILSVSLSPATVTGGTSATGTVTLAGPAPSGGTFISLTSTHSAAGVPSSLTIPAGSTSGTFPITTSAVGTTVSASIQASSTNTASQILTVLSPCISGLTLSIGSLVGGQNTTGTVTLTGPAPSGGASIPLAYVGSGVTGPANVVVPAGATSATFSVGTAAVSTILSSTIQALFGACSPVTVNLSVTPAILSGLNLSPSTLNLLGASTGTVTLNGPAPAGGRVVSLSTDLLLSQLGFPSTVTIPAGATSANFTVSNLLSALSGLLQPLTGTLSATLNGVTVNTGVTLRVL